jgi:hypothetical protein
VKRLDDCEINPAEQIVRPDSRLSCHLLPAQIPDLDQYAKIEVPITSIVRLDELLCQVFNTPCRVKSPLSPAIIFGPLFGLRCRLGTLDFAWKEPEVEWIAAVIFENTFKQNW